MTNQASKVIGQQMIKDGQTCTVIAYRSAQDIDVQFEDGTIIEHKAYHNFIMNKIRNPNLRIGMTNTSTRGQKMTIVRYNTCEDMDVEFEDGTIVTTRFKHFKSGRVRNPNYRIEEKHKLSNGETAEIIDYKNYKGITVKVGEETYTDVRSSALKKGYINTHGKSKKLSEGS